MKKIVMSFHISYVKVCFRFLCVSNDYKKHRLIQNQIDARNSIKQSSTDDGCEKMFFSFAN